MATVLSVVTAITTNSVSRCDVLPGGSTVLMATAAEAPQMATEPPVRAPNQRLKPNALAIRTPKARVDSTARHTPKTVCQPSMRTSPMAILRPSSATPMRSTVPAENSTPGRQAGCSRRKLKASPSSKAINIAGAPYRWDRKEAAIATVTVTQTPGK